MLTLNAGSTRASSRIRTTWNFFLWGEMLPLRLGFLVVSFALKWSTGQVLLLNWSTTSLFWHKNGLLGAAAECRCRMPLQNADCCVRCGAWVLAPFLCCSGENFVACNGTGVGPKQNIIRFYCLQFAMFKPKQKNKR